MVEKRVGVRLTLSDKLTGGLRGSLSRIRRFSSVASKSFVALNRSVFNLRNAFVGLVGVGLTGFAAKTVTDVAAMGTEFNRLTRRLGLSTEFLSEFAFAARQAGIDSRTLFLALQRAQRRFGEIVRSGGQRGTALPAVQELGILEEVLQGQGFEELLPKISDGLAQIDSESRRLSIVFQLLDSEGAKLVQTLGLGSRAIEDFREQARRLGLTFSADAAEGAENFTQAIGRLVGAFQGIPVQFISGQGLDRLTRAIDLVTDALVRNRAAIVSFLDSVAGVTARAASVLNAVVASEGNELVSIFRSAITRPIEKAFEGLGDRIAKRSSAIIGELNRVGRELTVNEEDFLDRFEALGEIASREGRRADTVNQLGQRVAAPGRGLRREDLGGSQQGPLVREQALRLERFNNLIRSLPNGTKALQVFSNAMFTVGRVAEKSIVAAESAFNKVGGAIKDAQKELDRHNEGLQDTFSHYEEFSDRVQQIERDQKALNDSILGVNQGLLDLRERFSAMEQSRILVNRLGDAISDSIVDSIDDAVKGTFRLRDALLNLLGDVRRALTRSLVNQLIGVLIGNVGGGGGGNQNLPPIRVQGNVQTLSGQGVQQSGSSSASGRPSGVQGPLREDGSFQGGGVVTGSRPVRALLHPPEAVIPLESGSVPVRLTGARGGSTTVNQTVINVEATDADSFNRLFQSGTLANRELIADTVASETRRRPGLRAQMA